MRRKRQGTLISHEKGQLRVLENEWKKDEYKKRYHASSSKVLALV